MGKIIMYGSFKGGVGKIRSRINNRLSAVGILLTMCDNRTNLCKVISEEVTETFQGQSRILESRIPITVKVGESIYSREQRAEWLGHLVAAARVKYPMSFS